MSTGLLELKARCANPSRARRWLDANASSLGTYRQLDTYFHVPRGRLKVRETDGEEGGSLIFYLREDIRGPKRSRILLLRMGGIRDVKEILSNALGTLVTVEKVRIMYRWGRVQVHLDDVVGLGSFVEFERKGDRQEDEHAARKEFQQLREALDVTDEDLVAGSYSDLLLAEASSGD
ncbi:MAG: class IV adenylate cyclase [Thermoplasmata archaeon]